MTFDERMDTAKKQEAADLAIALASPLWPRAVAWLKASIPALLPEQIREAIARDGRNWITPYHFDWGMAMRNALRQHGFGEDAFGVQNLDNIYVPLIEAAVKDTP